MKILLALLLSASAFCAHATYIPSDKFMDVQSSVPITSGTVTVTQSGKNIVVALNPAGTLAALTVNMPSSPFAGQVVTISSSQIITTLTLANGTILNAVTSLVLGGYCGYVWDSSAAQWRRVQ